MARLNRPVSRRQTHWLLASALAAFLPLTPYLPLWLTLSASAMFLWRGLLNWRQWRQPPRILMVLLVFIGVGAVLFQYRSLMGRTPGVSMLAIFLSLKLLELRSARDAIASALLCYFLVLGQFLFTQTLLAAALACITLVVTTATLLAANDDRPTPRQHLRRASLMLLQATPFMLVLFILFPRIQGPLWGLPQDRSMATSGLSDSLSPGSIARISQSDAIAFRVKFAGDIPLQAQLYWRGPVMSEYDGRTWRVGQTRGDYFSPPWPAQGPAIDYEVTLEPHGKFWLFALELPGTVPPDSALSRDYQPLAREAARSRLRYRQTAWPEARAGLAESADLLRAALALPSSGNPRTRAHAAAWRQQHGDDKAAIVAAAEAFFLSQFLTYTLNPPLLGENSVDEFLFDSKQGFCEHFAAAFVFALRAAGVPARIVAGYQGGEVNPIDGYLVVRQYDAHAWTEVWIDGQGWRRIDPTAISAPSRVANPLATALPQNADAPFMLRQAWLQAVRHRLDAIGNGWNQWVLGYNPQRQRDLLAQLGIPNPDWQNLIALLAALCGATMIVMAFLILHRRRTIDPSYAVWLKFARRLEKRDIRWQRWEGPLDFARRAAQRLPHRAAEIVDIAEDYAALRYAAPTPPDERQRSLARLRAKVRGLRLD